GRRRMQMRGLRHVVLAEKRVQQIFERAASAQNARFDGAYATFEDFCDFLVAEPFEIAQDDRAAENIGDLAESVLYNGLDFARRELIEWRCMHIFHFKFRLAFFWFRVDWDIFLQVALEPAAVIQGFANGDTIKPGFQRAALAEI